MNATLEDRLRRHYDERTRNLPQQGPGLEDGTLLTRAPVSVEPRPNRPLRIAVVLGTAAAALVIGLVVVNRHDDTRTSTSSTATPSSEDTTTSEPLSIPGSTLPPAVDLVQVPVTVMAGSPLSYWRWLPDLDIAERQTAQGGTELCWRTPAGTGCLDDSFASPQVGIIPTDGGAILLARPAIIAIEPPPTDPSAPKFELGPNPTTVTATMSDGSTQTAQLTYGEEFGVGYTRIQLPEDLSVSSAVSE